MASSHFLALDLGASTVRAMLGTLTAGRIELRELNRFRTPIVEHDGHIYWDIERIRDGLDEALDLTLATAPDLKALSVTSWGVDYVPLDAHGEPVRPTYCYRDTRTRGLMERAFESVPAAEIYATTGIQFMEINTLYQVLADRLHEPALIERTRSRLPIADYFHYLYAGKAVSEVSLASTTQLMDVHSRAWAYPLMERLDVPTEGWPEIVSSGTVLAPWRRSERVQVVASCSHDTSCAVAATPGEAGRSWAYISCGSWSLLGIERSTPLLTDAAFEAGFTNEAGLDGTIRLLKNLNGLWVLQECERAWAEEGASLSYETLLAEAEEAPSAGFFVDLNDPSFGERGAMVEKLNRYARRHGYPAFASRGALVRAVLESLARSYADTLRVLEGLIGADIEVVHIVGGGALNTLLCQWTADACGREVVAGPVEATALGNLLIQARAVGAVPDTASIRSIVRASFDLRTYAPRLNSVFSET